MAKLFKLIFSGIISASLILSCHTVSEVKVPTSNRKQLKSQISTLVNDPNLANGLVGIHIESLKDGSVLYSQNEHKIFMPASNMKLFTSAAGLVKLGPEFRYKTDFKYLGKMTDNTLNGDLIIKGAGDPTISGRFRDENLLAYFEDWADSLKKHGIDRIEGDLIGDISAFSGPPLGEGWGWDDQPYWYSAQTGALCFNDNCVDLTIRPGQNPGDPVTVSVSPRTDYVEIQNRALTVPADSSDRLRISRLQGTNVIEIWGTMSRDTDKETESITVEKPALYFLTVLRNVLQEKGIEVAGTIRAIKKRGQAEADSGLVFSHLSPPLQEIIRVINKPSHNLYAEQMLMTLGAEFEERGSADLGSKVVSAWLHSIGVAPAEFVMVDGSGLSRKNLVAPLSTAALLRYMYHHKNFDIFYNSLPIAGVDGTIKGRMKGTKAEGNVHAKTGYVRHVRSLSGYVHDLDGNPWIFVTMVNHYTVPTAYVSRLQDRICILLSNFSEGNGGY